MDNCGRLARGLQNRLRGAVEASWVGSIPIHPAKFRRFDIQDDSHNGGLQRTPEDRRGS